jgi:hypothetical protein
MDPDQTARMCRLVWIHAGHKRTMLILSRRGSIMFLCDEVMHMRAESLRIKNDKTIFVDNFEFLLQMTLPFEYPCSEKMLYFLRYLNFIIVLVTDKFSHK